MRSIHALISFAVLFALALVACTVDVPPDERLGTTNEALIAQGGRCLANSQCASGFCVDTVCCNTACGFGARDDFACSNIYGNVPGLVDGTCKHLTKDQPCGSLTSFNPCRWRGSDINGGGNCPAPGDGTEFACQACNVSADCPAGLPVCINHGCTSCVGDFGAGGTLACPTAGKPACVTGACLECSQTNATACTGNKGSCDVDNNVCVGCSGDFNSTPGPSNKFPCSAAKPACLPSGACGECRNPPPAPGVACTKDPTKTICDATNVCVNCVDSSTCPGDKPVCTNKVCTPCNGNHSSGATSACPTTTEPACIPSPVGPGTCAQCSASDATECALIPGKPVCDTTNDLCVQCNGNPDCAAEPVNKICNSHVCTASCNLDTDCGGGTPRCNNHVCVACTDDSTCSGTTPTCDPATNMCVECLSSAACTKDANKPVCSSTHACVPCDGKNGGGSPNACPSTTLPACNDSGACVQCNAGEATLCKDATPACNLTTNVCVECVTNATCVGTGPKPICDTSTSTCVGCTADRRDGGPLACPNPLLPACVSGTCLECKTGDTDACTPGEPLCDNAAHDCVQCLSNSDCTGSSGICNLATHTCGPGCATDANCTSPTPRCKVTAASCVQCLDFNDCGGTTPQCNTTTNTCVQCVTDAQCSGNTPRCDTPNGVCVACNGDFNTGATHACLDSTKPACLKTGANAGSCAVCSSTNTSQCAAPTTQCGPGNTCVPCSTNAQCSGATPICSPTGTCIACNGNLGSGATAACGTAALPACHSGTCVECRPTNVTACTSALPVCDGTHDVCVECNADPDCKGANGKCDVSTHTCTTGCSTNANCSSSDPVCSNGICVECTPTDASKCVAPTTHCDAPTSTCVECTAAADCPNDKPVCSSVTHTCTTDCIKSAECPGGAPICNPTTGHCVACVDNSQCNSPTPRCDGTTGTCQPPLDDGGTDGGVSDAGSGNDGGGGKTDAGISDAGYGGGADAATPGSNAGGDQQDVYSVEGGGCNCRTTPSRNVDGRALLAFGLALTLLARRRGARS